MKDISEYSTTYSESKTKPKNWSRNNFICSCNIPVFYEKTFNRIDIKYKVEFINTSLSNMSKSKQKLWFSYIQTNQKITHLKLPEIFENLTNEDFSINMGYLKRDRIQIPTPIYINIQNVAKYKVLLTKEERRKKLQKLM